MLYTLYCTDCTFVSASRCIHRVPVCLCKWHVHWAHQLRRACTDISLTIHSCMMHEVHHNSRQKCQSRWGGVQGTKTPFRQPMFRTNTHRDPPDVLDPVFDKCSMPLIWWPWWPFNAGQLPFPKGEKQCMLYCMHFCAFVACCASGGLSMQVSCPGESNAGCNACNNLPRGKQCRQQCMQ